MARVIFSRRPAEQAGVEEAFEAGAPIDEVALGKLNSGNDDPPAADLAFDKEAARAWQRCCAGARVELDARPGDGGTKRYAWNNLSGDHPTSAEFGEVFVSGVEFLRTSGCLVALG